jgi:hypothetical protein
MNITISTLKRGLLAFWATYYTLVSLTNLLDGLKNLRILPSTWSYVSGNFALLKAVTHLQGLPDVFNSILFFGVILLETSTAILFWFATMRFSSGNNQCVDTAFAFGISLWAMMIIAIELFIGFEVVSPNTFFELMIASILSFFLISSHTINIQIK